VAATRSPRHQPRTVGEQPPARSCRQFLLLPVADNRIDDDSILLERDHNAFGSLRAHLDHELVTVSIEHGTRNNQPRLRT
jgi:hypothetical protein